MLAETGLLHNAHEDSFPAIMPFWLVFRNRISGLPTAYRCGYVPLYLFFAINSHRVVTSPDRR